MEGHINAVITCLLHAKSHLLYFFLFVSAIMENLFPPIPGDTITAFGAFLVGTGRLNYWLVYLSTTAGSIIGFMALYFLGRLLGREFFMAGRFAFFSKKSIQDAEHWFGRYGHFVVFANRFLPGVRSVISIVAGISLVPPLKALVAATLSAAAWNLLWIEVGYTLGNNWHAVRAKAAMLFRNYNIGATVVMACLAIAYAAYRIIRWRRGNNSAQ